MALTDAQYVTLANDITVVHAVEFADELATTNDQAIADAYNLEQSPLYWVWRTAVKKSEIVGRPSVDGTTFIWTGNGFIARSVTEIMAWQEIFTGREDEEPAVNASLPQVRQAFADIFSGTGNAASNRTHLLACARRHARRIERLFATGTGSTASPGLMTFEGTVTYLDIAHALRGVPI